MRCRLPSEQPKQPSTSEAGEGASGLCGLLSTGKRDWSPAVQRASRAAEALSAARAKMQHDTTVALAMLDLPKFVLVWGTGAGTNSLVPENISHMTKQELATFVWMLGYGSIEHIRNVHVGQRRYAFFIYLAFDSKAARTRGTADRGRTSIARSYYARWADYEELLGGSRSKAKAALGDVHVFR
jgi:hypothetical protein